MKKVLPVFMRNLILNICPNLIIKFIIKLRRKKNTFSVLNININPIIKNQRKVLIAYQTDLYKTNSSKWTSGTRNNELSIIIRYFIERDYRVDIFEANVNDVQIIDISTDYNIIFGFGSLFYNASLQNKNAKKILYLTEKHPDYSYKKEKERIDYFKERHKREIGFSRHGRYYKNEYFDIADSIIFIGNENENKLICSTKPKYSNIVTGLVNKRFDITKKNYLSSKNNFLWFGSMGAVHKGLDILIDVFKEKNDCNLYIAGLSVLEKKALRMFNITNIIDVGFVNVQSDDFLSLMYNCNYIVMPSCSEGISTSVLTCMNHGLIPIITEECGLIDHPNIIKLKDYRVEHISDVISDVLIFNNQEIESMSKTIIDIAISKYNLIEFKNQIYSNLDQILNNTNQI